MSDAPLTNEEIVAHRVGGATYEAIALLYDLNIAKVRYICQRAAMAGKVTPEQIRWRRIEKPLRISPEVYNEHWMKRVLSLVKQDENGCWIWQRSVHGKGYGQTAYRKRTVRVHRQMYEIVHGVTLTDDQYVCHHCDVRRCCNPMHLFLGTNDDNMADKTRKGRHHSQRVTHCPLGHPYDEENTYRTGPQKARPNGARNCKACARVRQRVKAGWTLEQAMSLPVTPPGQRPVNAKRRHAA